MNTESVKNDRAWTCEGEEMAFIALFAVGVKYVNEAANSGITTRDDRGSDGVSMFSSWRTLRLGPRKMTYQPNTHHERSKRI
jgi:hypothetical protein